MSKPINTNQNSPYTAVVFRGRRFKSWLSTFLCDTSNIQYIKALGLSLNGPKIDSYEIELCTKTKNKPGRFWLSKWFRKQMTIMQFNWCYKFLNKSSAQVLILWNGTKGSPRIFAETAKKLGKTIIFVEGGMVPGRLTLDSKGIHYGSSLPRTIDFYYNWAKNHNGNQTKWRTLIKDLTARSAKARKDIVHLPATEELKQQNFIFCPLQEPGDSQVTIYGGWAKSVDNMINVLHEAAKSLPDNWHLRIKEHPSAQIKDSFKTKLKQLEGDKFKLDNSTSTLDLMALSQGVININSSVGLQSFFYDKPVIVLGKASYGIKELVYLIEDIKDLKKLLASPQTLKINTKARNAYMSYITEEYYPKPKDLANGSFNIKHLFKRDKIHLSETL